LGHARDPRSRGPVRPLAGRSLLSWEVAASPEEAMLSPKNRMRHSSEFGTVMRAGRRSSRDTLGVVYLSPPTAALHPGDGLDPPRVGFIVSKAVGGAVVRKRVQRRLRHLMRSRLGDLPDGSLLVVRAKPSSSTARSEDLAVQLD